MTMSRKEALVQLVAGQLPVVREVVVMQPREIENAVDRAIQAEGGE